jgi:hypothetical protein
VNTSFPDLIKTDLESIGIDICKALQTPVEVDTNYMNSSEE